MSTLLRCKFWDKCYRKNPEHLKQYLHPSKPDATKTPKASDAQNEAVSALVDANSDHVTAIKPKMGTEGVGEGEGGGGGTTKYQPTSDRKRRLSDCDEIEEERDGDGGQENVGRNKKSKLDDDEEVTSANVMRNGESQAEREKEVPSAEKKRGDGGDEIGDGDDDDDDFLTIVSTGKKDEKNLEAETNASKVDLDKTLSLSTGEMLKLKYSMEFPSDLVDFWDFCRSKSPLYPTKALAEGGLILVGPFDLLAAKKSGGEIPDDADFHLHWRFFFDPPEFMTTFSVTGADSADYEQLEGLHYGYFRDDPKEMPAFVASSSKASGGTLKRAGGNLFAAAISHLNSASKVIDSKRRKQRMKDLAADLTSAARIKGHEVGAKTEAEKRREKKVMAKPFHGVGMVVPFDKKTEVGYRELPETNSNLKKLFTNWCEAPSTISPSEDERLFARIQEILTFVQFANDECDYGMGLELGLDLFSFGHNKFQRIVHSVLPLAYKLLDRQLFAEISENHLNNRTDSLVPKQF